MDTAIAPSTASELSTDPVSSLRAAALSTLKAKRRKPQPDRPSNLPVRPPPPTDTFHLDYGADDGPRDVLMKDASFLPTTPAPPKEKVQLLPAREEGEISEEDEPPPVKSPFKTPLSTVSSTANAITPEPRQGLEADRPRQTTPLHKETTPVAKSVALPDSSRSSLSVIPRTSDTPMEGVILNEPHLVSSPLGLDHIRPRLRLTQHQYDTVKDIILDLLGWGVPPAYLIDSGVSREAVFYVFSELNLALPDGFDTTGLIPYLPDLSSQSQQSTEMLPPPLPDNRANSMGVRSHPAKHQVEVKPGTNSSTPSLDLHDIERQRRQELLARKAAQASRKMRQSTSLGSSSGSSTTKEVLTMTPASATEAVDDFLNSIGPVGDLGINNRTKSISPDDMDIQDTPTTHDAEPHVRRLSSSSGSQSTPSQDTLYPAAPIQDLYEVGLVTNQPPPPSSSSSGFSQISDSEVIPSPRFDHSNVRSRRGMKRAVATDFDFDAVPRKAGSAYPPAKQPKTAFVTIASRRCVIDLSDSEAEDDPSRYTAHPLGLDKNVFKAKLGANASPSGTKPSTPSGTATPSALLEKEREIQKMRELIARREEETRLKKAAKAASTPSNDDTAGPNIIQPQPVRLKIEETDVDMSAASPLIDYDEMELIARRSSESASPPGEICEASLPVTRSITKSPIVKSSMQHIGDQDLASTTQDTQVQPNLSTDLPPFMFSMVDVDMFPSSSAEMNKSPRIISALPKLDGRNTPENPNHDDPQPSPEYIDYLSPFDFYPLLRSQSSISGFSSSLFMHTTSVTSNIHSSPTRLASSSPPIGPFLVPDLKPLRLAVLSKRLDPSKRLCQYESGGGTCRDDKCEDLHLTRLEGMNASGLPEPTDKETADFLFSVLPHSWLSTYQVYSPDRILEALQEAQQQTTNDLADKVASAIALIGSFPPPTST